MTILRVEVDEDTRRNLEMLAIQKGTSLKELLPQIVKEYSASNAVPGMAGAEGG